MLTALLGIVAVAGAAAAAWWRREAARLTRTVEERERQVAQWQALMGDGTGRASRTSRSLPTPALAADTGDPLGDLLRVIRDAMGAESVVWWRRASDGTMAPQASSQAALIPAMDAAAPHAAWADTEGLVSIVSLDDGVLVVGPVPAVAGAETRGALVARGPSAWPADRADAKRRLEQYGGAVARTVLLLESQRSAAEFSAGIRKVLELTRDYASARDPERLSERVCESIVALYGMQRAAIVRWTAGRAEGRVAAVSQGHAVVPGQVVGPISAVGVACTDARQVLWQDAATVRQEQPIFDDGEPGWKTGALLVVPLVRGRAVLGAVVAEAGRAGGVREHAIRMISLHAELLTPQLETLWNFEEVERRARTDALTGLWNRRHVDGELARWVSYVDRYGGQLAVILVDVDHFKRVNDTHGHEAGDAVLQHVASVLRDGAREQDIVARLGGEEFVLLLPSTPPEAAADVAERLRATLAGRAAAIGGTELPVTASFGVSGYPAPVGQRDRVLPAADAALYAAKRDGRNCVRVASR